MGTASCFVVCSENGCTAQVCVGDPGRECYSRIDQSPQASSMWLCEAHQHKTVLNVGIFFLHYHISLTSHPQYRCNRQLSGIFRVHVLNPLIIVHVYGSDEDIVPTSINWRHLDDFFSASADRLVRSEIMAHFLYANCATPACVYKYQLQDW